MVTQLQINKSIVDTIKSALVSTEFSAVPLIAEDVTKPIQRPGIKVEIENSTNGKFNSRCREKKSYLQDLFLCIKPVQLQNRKRKNARPDRKRLP